MRMKELHTYFSDTLVTKTWQKIKINKVTTEKIFDSQHNLQKKKKKAQGGNIFNQRYYRNFLISQNRYE